MSKYGVFSGPYFLVFGLNTEICVVNFCIQSKYRKIRTRKTSVFGLFSRSVRNPKSIEQTLQLIKNQQYFKGIFRALLNIYPAGIYLLKVSNRNTRTSCEIYLKLTIKTLERRHWRRSGVFMVNFEHISHLVLVFLLLILNM